MKLALCVLLFLVSETGARSRFDSKKVEVKAHAPVYTWNFTLDEMFQSGMQQLSACRRDLRVLEREIAHLESRGQTEAGTVASSVSECTEPPSVDNAIATRAGNEAWYSCKDNFRFRGTSQSASCSADGEWKFFSNSVGVCTLKV